MEKVVMQNVPPILFFVYLEILWWLQIKNMNMLTKLRK